MVIIEYCEMSVLDCQMVLKPGAIKKTLPILYLIYGVLLLPCEIMTSLRVTIADRKIIFSATG
jgi:hypothetical protein